MPAGAYGYKKRRRFKKRRFRHRKSRFFRKITGPSSSLPTTRVIGMRYQDELTFSPSLISPLSTYVYRANSIFDPDFTGVGHQPLGHDEWSKFYNKYVVLGSKITIRSQTNNAVNIPCIVGIQMSDASAVVAATSLALIEQGTAKWCFFSGTTNGRPAICSQKYSAKRWHNVKNAKDAYGLLADMGSNPTDQTYFIVFGSAYDGLSAASQQYLTVTIEYIVELSDPVELVQS